MRKLHGLRQRRCQGAMKGRLVARHVRRICYRFNSTDVRRYALTESLRRARSAVERAGGILRSGIRSPPVQTRRWCVLRSPHVNKKSREHFWMRIHRSAFDWDAETGRVPDGAEYEIAEALPPNLATRVTVNEPALLRLRAVWDTMQRSRKFVALTEPSSPSVQ